MSGFHANRGVAAVFAAKAVRTFCYGYLGILLPLYLADLGLSARGIGLFVTATLAGSAALTWAIRAPSERFGARAALVMLAGLSVMAHESANTGQLAVSEDECRDVLWAMTDGMLWHRLVYERGWTNERFADWLGRMWIDLLVLDRNAPRSSTRRRG